MDLFNLPNNFRGDVRVFTALPYNLIAWETWNKPRGCTMAHFFVVGGGAGGGGGFSGIAGSARGGGAGGASAAAARLTIPLSFLPDVLYMVIGLGTGTGAVPGGTGGNASQSFISLVPNTNSVTNYLLLGSGNGNAGANPGTATGGGVGQAGQAATTIGVNPLAGLGIYSFVGGQSGGNGGAHTGAIGGAVAFPSNGVSLGANGGILVQAGAGGAGTTSGDFAGGALTPVSNSGFPSFISEYLPPAAPAGSNNGCDGLTLWKPFFGMGGSGGASSNTGVGGNGGKGGIGAGGGGGGGGTTGGRGGDGGDGCIIVVCW